MIHLHRKRYEYLEEVNRGVTSQIPDWQGPGESWVLDVGCGSGALSAAIRAKGYRVCGVEENAGAAEAAARRIDQVLRHDLLDVDAVRAAIGDRKFDWLVFSDVLEHLYDPFTVLSRYLEFVKDGGRVVVSVPNALTWTNRIAFLFGRFEYADTGVMDRTHIRWFTFATAKRLVRATGCRVERVDYTPFLVRAALPLLKRAWGTRDAGDRRRIIDSPAFRFYDRYVYPVEYVLGCWWKSLFAFRIMIVGLKERPAQTDDPVRD